LAQSPKTPQSRPSSRCPIAAIDELAEGLPENLH